LSPSSIAQRASLEDPPRGETGWSKGGSYVSFVETDGDAALFLAFCCHCVVMAVVDVVVADRGLGEKFEVDLAISESLCGHVLTVSERRSLLFDGHWPAPAFCSSTAHSQNEDR
jgi:hypothetical protein